MKAKYPPFIIGSMRLGTWGKDLSIKDLKHFVDGCLDLGLKHFDHADIYGGYTTEEWFGELIKSDQKYQNDIEITTKCGIRYVGESRPNHFVKHYDLSSAHIIASAENSLKALGVERINSFLLHRPDYLMNPHEIAAAFEHLVASGKVKQVGLSNFTYDQTQLIHRLFPIDVLQLEISAMNWQLFESAIPAYCQLENIALTSWSPLGGGSIFSPRPDDQCKRIIKVLDKMAEKYQADHDQLLFAWLRTHPCKITPVTGTANIGRIQRYIHRGEFVLSEQDWYLILEAARGEKVA